jgi:DNA polymerase I-like protein with 3'-5' exonuclease and polymerase domains
MRYAIFRCYRWIKRENLFDKVKILSTIHDELNFEVKGKPGEEEFESLVKKLKEIMEWTPKSFTVPVAASVSVGTSWGDVEERK